MQILPNCLYVVAHGSYKTTIGVEGMQKSCLAHFPLAQILLTELIYYLDVLLDQEGEGRHRAERVQNADVSCVGT